MARKSLDRLRMAARRTVAPTPAASSIRAGAVQAASPLERTENSDLRAVSLAPRFRLLRFPAVRERTGLSRSTIWRLERRGEFPRHHRISANAVAWLEEDVAAWIRARTRETVPLSTLDP
jgi:prophage regulatory protein